MSKFLWRYYLEDDVDSFRHLLQGAGAGLRPHTQKGVASSYSRSYDVDDHALDSTSPPSPVLRGKAPAQKEAERTTAALTRADINSKDTKGLTLLHHAASSTAHNAIEYAIALLSQPFIDLYIQDLENGWTPLHRAFYFGNIAIARAILERDAPHAGNLSAASGQIGSLAKVKDREGYGPYDLFSATIADRSLRTGIHSLTSDDDSSSDGGLPSGRGSPEGDDSETLTRSIVPPTVNVRADEFFTFGSNKNLTLGLGDQDDRHFPERIHLKRPQRLFERFYRKHVAARASGYATVNPAYAERYETQVRGRADLETLPDVIKFRPIIIQDVQMSKFHTAVLTADPVANLYVCGHGPGGRLGIGSEKTLFNFKCLDEFGSARISSIALGQDHTLAVTDRGELYSWGSNVNGQLGCGMARDNPKPEDAMQLSPKQIFGPMKKETIVGVAASRIHSVAHTSNALFTFGKNEGQLGLVDSQAGTLRFQTTPRQVYASRLASNIHSVSAIDRATIILLENREVHVFANFGAVKLQFPLDGFSNYFLRSSFLTTKYDKTPNKIIKITSGGDTICALSSSGEVFTVTVNQRLDPSASGSSTTNPHKIKAALSTPYRAWALRSDRTSARDVGVDADGSIILCTEAGGVFRRIRRPKAAGRAGSTGRDQKSKEFKFMRVPNLTRAVGVRASSSGAYCALREDCNVTRTELESRPKTLWRDIFGMLPFRSLADESPAPSFWQRPDAPKKVIDRIAQAQDVESEVTAALRQHQADFRDADVAIRSTVSDHVIPAHQVILTARSSILRQGFGKAHRTGNFDSEAFTIDEHGNARFTLTFKGLDYLTLLELTLYVYSDALVGFWRLRHRSPEMAFRYKQVRSELMKVGTKLELRNLEAAARRVITRPEPSMSADFELALLDRSFCSSCDARVQLADGEILVDSGLISKRCPFFEGLFQGHAGGTWLAARSQTAEKAVEVDLSHIEVHVFKLVLRYIYCDTGEEMFDDVATGDVDEFLDLVMEVLSAANELMLDNLSRICQVVMGRYVTTRNACQLLNAVAPSSVQDFKNVTLEYLCLSLEPLLANHWLDELDEDLLSELNDVVRENQTAAAPFVRSGRMQADLHEAYPELADILVRARQAKIDALDMKTKFPDAGTPTNEATSRFRSSPALRGKSPNSIASVHSSAVQSAKSKAATSELEPLPSPAQSSLPPAASSPLTDATPAPSREASGRPWGPTPLPGAKLGMKDIMDQASASRTSNLSLGIESQVGAERQSVSAAASKISQKQRKRQQQQQQRPNIEYASSAPPVAEVSSPAAVSPWRTVSGNRAVSPSVVVSSPTSQVGMPGSSSSPVPRTPSTPQLTMRQTIANAPAAKSKEVKPESPSTPRQGSRSVSTPGLAQTPTSAKAESFSSDSRPVQIQSIRHQARPELSPEFYMNQSLADIMSNEQAEKSTLKDAIAKRSLQEIQEEQVFQVCSASCTFQRRLLTAFRNGGTRRVPRCKKLNGCQKARRTDVEEEVPAVGVELGSGEVGNSIMKVMKADQAREHDEIRGMNDSMSDVDRAL